LGSEGSENIQTRVKTEYLAEDDFAESWRKTIHPVVTYGRWVGDRSVLLLHLRLKVLSSDLCGNLFIENCCTLDKKFIPHRLNAARRFWHNDFCNNGVNCSATGLMSMSACSE